jgi:hypothetical protein
VSAKDAPRAGRAWVVVGWVLSALWVAFVLAYSRGDPRHPLFEFIFVVPLAGWIAAFVVTRVWRTVRERKRADGGSVEAP